METNYLYSLAEKEKIEVVDYSFNQGINGIYIDTLKCIGLDKSLNDTERKCVLAEELGHYYCNATYPLSCTDKTVIDKAECRAKKWSIKALISPSDLNKVKLLGLKYKWEIAEFLGVTEDIAEKAINYYSPA